MITNANEIKFRCSSLGHLMSKPKEKTETLSVSAKKHLVDVFISQVYGRREELTNKFIEKGNKREEDSITLIARKEETMLKKNEERLADAFIMGTPDTFVGKEIRKALKVWDAKSSFSLHTYMRAITGKLNQLYYWQGQGYMRLTGAKNFVLVYCLVNGLAKQIDFEKYRAQFDYPDIDVSKNPKYIERCKQIERNHIFDMDAFIKENPGFSFAHDIEGDEWKFDIPIEQRTHAINIPRNEADIKKIEWTVLIAREWMNQHLFKKLFKQAA